MALQEIQGFTSFIARKKIHVKNVKNYREYFQIEQDDLIFCKKNKHQFAEHCIPMQRKLAMEISNVITLELIQNGHANFKVQNLREVIQTTMEISKVNISVQLIENDYGNFQRQNFGWYKWRRIFPKTESEVNPNWRLKFPTSKL